MKTDLSLSVDLVSLEASYHKQHEVQIKSATSLEYPAFPQQHPELMTVRIVSMEFYESVKSNVIIKMGFRKKNVQTLPTRNYEDLFDFEQEFPLTYHSVLFDSLKLSFYAHKTLSGWRKIAGVRIRIAKLPTLMGLFRHQVDIKRPKLSSSPHQEETSIGSMQLEFNFVGGNLDMQSIPMTPSTDLSESSFLSIADTDLVTDSVGELMNYFEKAGLEIDGHETARSIGKNENRFKRFINLNTKLTPRPGSVLSERTKMGLKEFAEFSASFFKTGWNLSKMDLVRALSFVQRYYANYYTQPRSLDIVLDTDKLKIALYWLNFTVAAYGAFVINWCGYGSGFILDKFKTKADKKAAIKVLGIGKEDMLVWEFEGNEMFKPSFYICRDVRTKSIVLSIRGTWSIQDTLTDLCAEYEPYQGGFGHRGFLRSADWILDHYLDKILGFIEETKSSAFYVTGHSLGGAIASLFTMKFLPYLAALRQTQPNFQFHCYNFASPPTCSINLAEKYEDLIDSFINENDIVPRMSYGAASDFKQLVLRAASIMRTKSSEHDKMEVLDMFRKKQERDQEHPKIYIAGNLHYIYKVSRATPKFSLEPKANFTSDTISKTYSSSPYIMVEAGHYVVEKTKKQNFVSMQLKNNLLFHHFPDRHEHAIRKAIEWLNLNNFKTVEKV